jgi:L-gulonate 5-dehydrogenase
MTVRDRQAPPAPGPGQVLLHPEAVGICGSDYSFFAGHLSPQAGGSGFPRVQGHELAGVIEALGQDCPSRLTAGQRVAVWPLHACGRCYPCRIGRSNVCEEFELTGIHLDGGLAERMLIGHAQLYPIAVADPEVAALAEPVSIAVRAVNRAAITRGEHAVVLGAGPIGHAIALVARERGAEVLLVDLLASRLALAAELGADAVTWQDAGQVVAAARQWAGRPGPPVVFDATGAAQAVQAMTAMVARAGRAVQVGMSGAEARIRVGLLTEKELDLLGVSCCGAGEFAEAVRVVERHAAVLAKLITHQFDLAEAPEAMRFAIDHPAEVMKVMIRC